MRTYVAKGAEAEALKVGANWHVIDATDMVLGRLASKVARLLIGKDNPSFTPYLDSGDHVVVITGKDKGKKGEVLKVMRDENRAIVQGVAMIKRHQRQTTTQDGGIISKEAAIHISNLALEDPKDGKPTRVGYKFLKDGRKVRFAKRSGEVIDG